MCLDRESLNILLRYRCVSWRSLFFWCGLNPYVLIHVTGSWWKSSIESSNFMPFRGTSKSDKLHAWQVMAQSLLSLRLSDDFFCVQWSPTSPTMVVGNCRLPPLFWWGQLRSAEETQPQPRGTWLSLGAFSAVLLTGSRFRGVPASEAWKRVVPSTPKGLNMYQVM